MADTGAPSSRAGTTPVDERDPSARAQPLAPDLELREVRKGSKPGSRYIRLVPRERRFERMAGGYRATDVATRPRSRAGRLSQGVRRVVIGAPLATSQLIEERLTKVKALAVFSSDNLSSSAYATEEILRVLILAGTGALFLSVPLTLAISALVVVVAISYTQTVQAYPNGGGAYIVAKDNLGTMPGLIAGASLLVDYVLTVAVSIAAGIAAITSAVPELLDLRVELAAGSVALITIANLRGIRESGTIFAVPAYLFVVSMTALIVTGAVRLALGQDLAAGQPPDAIEPGTQAIGLFLILRAYASGSAALTGIEAMSNGVPALKPPEARNAVITLGWMAGLLTFFFLGLTMLGHQMDIVPSETKTVVAQVAEGVFGRNVAFYLVQASTAIILILAANTSFADFPRLSSVMANDRFMPRQFTFRGDRLAFSTGIIVLGVASAALLVLFGAETHALIPLYAFGVFVGFTLSQTGMVVHWRRLPAPGNWLRLLMNGGGAVATAVVAVVILATKFIDGAWLSVGAIALLVFLFTRIQAHYRRLGGQLDVSGAPPSAGVASSAAPAVIVPVAEPNKAALHALAYAYTISPRVEAVHIAGGGREAVRFRRAWERVAPNTPLTIIDSPATFVAPFLAYLDVISAAEPNADVVVVVSNLVPGNAWEGLLHNRTGDRLKSALRKRRGTIIAEVPLLLEQHT